MIRFLDIFAGAGGLSEGFIRAGFFPVKHIEMDEAACNTLRTRAAYHYLIKEGKQKIYRKYLLGEISRTELYDSVPAEVIDSVIQEEISKTTLSSLFNQIDSSIGNNKINLIIGGPPCQAYSIAGRSRDPNRMVGDKRNYLYKLYAEFLRYYKPEYFVFENVLGLLSAKDEEGEPYLEKMINLFKQNGYETEQKVLNANDYGVLQQRRRIILIGKRGDERNFYPEITKIENKYTVSSVLKDLPKIHAGEGSAYGVKESSDSSPYIFEAKIRGKFDFPVTFHWARPNNERDLEIYRIAVDAWNSERKRLDYSKLPERLRSHKNSKDFVDRFKVVAGDMPYSQTIVAHISKDGHYYIHPDINQNRSLTPREAARLQTFPDDYFFESVKGSPSRTLAFKQIGNAVPVLLAEKIAEAIKPLFHDN